LKLLYYIYTIKLILHMSNTPKPSHATIRLNSYTTLPDLQVDSIDWYYRIVTVLVPFSENEFIKRVYSISEVESFTFPNCVNELI
jgi:hypothetical protein